MSLTTILDKYGAPKCLEPRAPKVPADPGSEAEEPVLGDWRESGPAVALSDHLNTRPDLGVWLVLKDGDLALHFEPGLRRTDQVERWTFAAEAVDLLQDAREDLGFIVEFGMLALPKM